MTSNYKRRIDTFAVNDRAIFRATQGVQKEGLINREGIIRAIHPQAGSDSPCYDVEVVGMNHTLLNVHPVHLVKDTISSAT